MGLKDGQKLDRLVDDADPARQPRAERRHLATAKDEVAILQHEAKPPAIEPPEETKDYEPVVDVQRQAMDRAARQSLQVIGQPVRSAAWHDGPSTYLLCTQDRGTPAERQRDFARRAGSPVEMAAGHHPFLSQPAAVRAI